MSLFCVAVALTVLMLPHQLLLDGWLTLVSGREVVTGGLPAADTLTVWTQGASWVDQQWLAQAAFYALAAAGGLPLVMLGHAALVAATIAISLAAARSLGGSPRNVGLVGTAAVLVAPWAIQLRTQSLVMPLFALLLWLLAADSRSPSRRVFLVFPLLVLWANLHGTVVLAALFVALRGVVYAFERRPRRAAAFTLVPFACVFASPYALDLAGYYESLFLEPSIRRIAPEWGASTVSGWTAAFYARRRRDPRAPGEEAPPPDPVRAGCAARHDRRGSDRNPEPALVRDRRRDPRPAAPRRPALLQGREAGPARAGGRSHRTRGLARDGGGAAGVVVRELVAGRRGRSGGPARGRAARHDGLRGRPLRQLAHVGEAGARGPDLPRRSLGALHRPAVQDADRFRRPRSRLARRHGRPRRARARQTHARAADRGAPGRRAAHGVVRRIASLSWPAADPRLQSRS